MSALKWAVVRYGIDYRPDDIRIHFCEDHYTFQQLLCGLSKRGDSGV
jgi:hypothetical protein